MGDIYTVDTHFNSHCGCSTSNTWYFNNEKEEMEERNRLS